MRRWWLVVALLLSLGVNVGVLGTLALHRLRAPEEREHRATDRDERGEREDRGDPEARTERRLARLGRMADRMGLEGAARERFLAQHRSFYLASFRDRIQLRRVQSDLRRELTASSPDRARIEALVGQEGRLHVALERAMAANVLATREMLDPEQEKVYLDFINSLRLRRFGVGEPGERRSRHRRRGGDGF